MRKLWSGYQEKLGLTMIMIEILRSPNIPLPALHNEHGKVHGTLISERVRVRLCSDIIMSSFPKRMTMIVGWLGYTLNLWLICRCLCKHALAFVEARTSRI